MELDVMLCDYAQVAGDKLFISGANIDRLKIPAGTPAPYGISFSAAGLVHIPWTATNAEHTLSFVFVTEDGTIPELPPGMPVPDQGIGGEMRFNVGRPPQLTGGEEQNIPFAFNLQGVPLMKGGRYSIVFSLDGTEARSIAFTVLIEPQQRSFGPASIPGM